MTLRSSARIGRHDVLIETLSARGKTFVYSIRAGRVVVLTAGRGYRTDLAAALLQAAARPAAPMLEVRIRNRYRTDTEPWADSLADAMLRVAKQEAVAGHFLRFAGRSGGRVDLVWRENPASASGPALWMETTQPGQPGSLGRFVTRADAAQVVEARPSSNKTTPIPRATHR
ncbi:hypothetical protein [Nocardia carnea]|uniref:hypothetical protein n=1 Tax=Nocardia carnea TaxID=37328 RepID=UPI0024573E24|nr:hypothetical protein [Nocardia carnea]